MRNQSNQTKEKNAKLEIAAKAMRDHFAEQITRKYSYEMSPANDEYAAEGAFELTFQSLTIDQLRVLCELADSSGLQMTIMGNSCMFCLKQ